MQPGFFFFANPYQAHGAEAALALAEYLRGRGYSVFCEPWLAEQGGGMAAALEDMPSSVQAVIAFGGDGTLLRAAPSCARQGIPMLGVHTGTVGFLMEGDARTPENTARMLLDRSYTLEAHPMLEVKCMGKRYLALNDLALTRGEHPGVIEVTVQADGERVMGAHGDGVVISTPLGATAYALSAGGPIVRPDVACLTVTAIAARELLLRPVILPLEAHITLTAHGRDRRRLQLAVDGQTLVPVTDEMEAQVTLAPERAQLIRPKEHYFFTTLRKKQRIWNQDEQE